MAVRPDWWRFLPTWTCSLQGPVRGSRIGTGRPFTAAETDLLVSATGEDMPAAIGELAGTAERLAELFLPYIRTVAEKISDPPAAEQP